MLSLTGMPDSVMAMARTSVAHRMECEDTVAAVLHYRNGAMAILTRRPRLTRVS